MPLIVLYDGLCGFCDGTVQALLARDRNRALRYAPLEGETAAAVRARHPEWPANLDSIVVVRGTDDAEQIAWESDAAWEILDALGGGWAWVARAGRLLPRALADAAYRLVARVRLRLAGRRAACRVPTPDQRARFLP